MKILKFTFLTTVILTLGTLFYSCSDDDSLNPISPKDREDTTIGLIYPSTNETGYTISLQGEDVNYSVKSEKDEIVIAEMISTTDLNLKAVSQGWSEEIRFISFSLCFIKKQIRISPAFYYNHRYN